VLKLPKIDWIGATRILTDFQI